MSGKFKFQFEYTFIRLNAEGGEEEREQFGNIVPDNGRDYIMQSLFNNGTRSAGFFLGLIGAAGYTPQYSDTPTFLAANAAEIVDYGASRPAFTGVISAGSWDNSASPASFVFTKAVTVYGGFLQSTSAFNAATGILLSTAKAPSPKPFAIGETLQVITSISLLT